MNHELLNATATRSQQGAKSAVAALSNMTAELKAAERCKTARTCCAQGRFNTRVLLGLVTKVTAKRCGAQIASWDLNSVGNEDCSLAVDRRKQTDV